MSDIIKKAELNRLLKGEPKKFTRGTIHRIVELGQSVVSDGIGYFPYYTKTLPEHEAFRASDTRKMLEREIGPFFYATGNWEHLYDGVDVMSVWQDESINEVLTDAGFKVRTQNTAARNADKDSQEVIVDIDGSE